MKLFMIAALVTVASAGRLEHLERSYLPPDNNAIGSGRSSFGSNGGFGSSHGSPGSQGGFGSHSSHGSFGAGPLSRNAGGSFAGATSNQYLAPDHGPSASNSAPQFAGSSQGFGGQNFRSQQYSGHQTAPAQQNGAPQAGSSFRQFPQQSAATSRQYLAPQTSSFQNSPQQAFDEQTGYQY